VVSKISTRRMSLILLRLENLLENCDLRLVAADSRLDTGAGNSPGGHPG
jgi:hypothetical protein